MAGESKQEFSKAELVEIVRLAVEPLSQNNKAQTGELLSAMAEIKSAQNLTNQKLETTVQLVESHDHILRGNGRVGLMTRIEQVESSSRDQGDDLQDVIETLRGTDDKPGLVGKVNQLEQKTEGIAKPLWIVLSALLGTGVTLIVTHLLK